MEEDFHLRYYICLFKLSGGARGMAQWLKMCIILPKELGSMPSTHVRQLTDSCNSSSRALDASGFHRYPHTWHPLTQAHTHMVKSKILKEIFFWMYNYFLTAPFRISLLDFMFFFFFSFNSIY